ncbi:MAG: hypothetical protein JWM95_2326 [Gemmatimonadetes bacterium]|nr:hypothetical protein [Gemmatimonadota bacterium]
MLGALEALELDYDDQVAGSLCFELYLHVKADAAMLGPIHILPESRSLLGFHGLVEAVGTQRADASHDVGFIQTKLASAPYASPVIR